ncbi:succinate dehydrogenase, cytochrome b556 subunit [Glacieibacterium sp.]|uniref:succinate dehydrogenase, cytochrome b556 subunit n=1 Tax=Glacieibacterium sp. TaxID=2860237 RepID=UPI003B00997D
MATSVRPRPLSPHLSIWKWRVHMTVSIFHRATGTAMATGGVVLFLWWLAAAATGAEAYATFYKVATGWFGILVGVGLTWVFFQHLMSGIRHLIMDTGAGLEIAASKRLATLTFVGSVLLTALTWGAILVGKGL